VTRQPEVQAYLDRVVSTLRDGLGDELVGVYLHGSLAMGAFHPGRSDVDILAVCATSLPRERRMAIGAALVAIPTPSPGGDLELSLVTEAAVRSRSAVPPFEVHASTHEEPFVVDGSDRPGDGDLVIHFAMARARGRALVGPEPGELFPEPVRASLIEAFLADLAWAKDEGAAAWEGHPMPELASMAPGVDRRALLAIRGDRRARFEGRGRRVARAPSSRSGHAGAARRGPGVPARRRSRSSGRTPGA
jgi:predicted nucleotidyltransferase